VRFLLSEITEVVLASRDVPRTAQIDWLMSIECSHLEQLVSRTMIAGPDLTQKKHTPHRVRCNSIPNDERTGPHRWIITTHRVD